MQYPCVIFLLTTTILSIGGLVSALSPNVGPLFVSRPTFQPVNLPPDVN